MAVVTVISCALQKERDSLLADATALKDLLSKSDREMAGKEEQLQEAERERTEWEIRAGRLEQFVDETRRAFDNQREVCDCLVRCGILFGKVWQCVW